MAQTLDQILFQRKYLLAQLEQGGFPDESLERETLIDQLNELDLRIAATPSTNIQDLAFKITRLAELIHPLKTPIPTDTLENIMLAAIVRGANAITVGSYLRE